MASVWGQRTLKLIDRSQRQVIKEFHLISEVRNNNQVFRSIGFNDYYFPYLFVKDMDKISIVNLRTLESVAVVPQNYQTQSWEFSIIQYKKGKILVRDSDGNMQVTIKIALMSISRDDNMEEIVFRVPMPHK